MSNKDTPLDADFIQRQRKQLETLQAELQASVAFRHEDDLQLQSDRENQSDAMGSDAQHIALEDNNRAISAHTQLRLDAVQRALAKIEDGSYGRSDESGEPIPRERLEARPESLYTVEEEEAREREARRVEQGMPKTAGA